MMSVNQLNIYHVALEMFNIMVKFVSDRSLTRQAKKKIMVKSSAERVQKKFTLQENSSYSLRNRENGTVKVPAKPSKLYFSYTGPKLFNFLPEDIRKSTDPDTFKVSLKKWIWDNIPSV